MSLRRFPILMLTAILLAGCAFTNPRNTPLVRWAEQKIAPDSKSVASTIAFLPIALPLGILDVFLIHPIMVIGDAAGDAGDIAENIWDHPAAGIASRSFFTIPLAVATVVAVPIGFVGSWLGRSCIDIDPRDQAKGAPSPPEDRSAELRRQIVDLRLKIQRIRSLRMQYQQAIADADAELPQLDSKLSALETELRGLEGEQRR